MTMPSKSFDNNNGRNFSRLNGLFGLIVMAMIYQAFWTRPIAMNATTHMQKSPGPPNSDLISSCSHMTFNPRTQEEDQQFTDAWTKTVDFVQKEKLTFLPTEILKFHRDLLADIEKKGIPGMIFECGVAKAGSSITFASYKHPQRCLHLFDTFEGIPEPSDKDGSDVKRRYQYIQKNKKACELGKASCDKEYYGNMDNLLDFDQKKFEEAGYTASDNSIVFHKGLFDDTVWPEGSIAYAHLDGDWYDSTYNMLERLAPHISIGGYFVLDDAYIWSGARDAYVDFFSVKYEWVEAVKEEGCTTTVTYSDGTVLHFLLKFDARAYAKAIDPPRSSTSATDGMMTTDSACKPPITKRVLR